MIAAVDGLPHDEKSPNADNTDDRAQAEENPAGDEDAAVDVHKLHGRGAGDEQHE